MYVISGPKTSHLWRWTLKYPKSTNSALGYCFLVLKQPNSVYVSAMGFLPIVVAANIQMDSKDWQILVFEMEELYTRLQPTNLRIYFNWYFSQWLKIIIYT